MKGKHSLNETMDECEFSKENMGRSHNRRGEEKEGEKLGGRAEAFHNATADLFVEPKTEDCSTQLLEQDIEKRLSFKEAYRADRGILRTKELRRDLDCLRQQLGAHHRNGAEEEICGMERRREMLLHKVFHLGSDYATRLWNSVSKEYPRLGVAESMGLFSWTCFVSNLPIQDGKTLWRHTRRSRREQFLVHGKATMTASVIPNCNVEETELGMTLTFHGNSVKTKAV